MPFGRLKKLLCLSSWLLYLSSRGIWIVKEITNDYSRRWYFVEKRNELLFSRNRKVAALTKWLAGSTVRYRELEKASFSLQQHCLMYHKGPENEANDQQVNKGSDCSSIPAIQQCLSSDNFRLKLANIRGNLYCGLTWFPNKVNTNDHLFADAKKYL